MICRLCGKQLVILQNDFLCENCLDNRRAVLYGEMSEDELFRSVKRRMKIMSGTEFQEKTNRLKEDL